MREEGYITEEGGYISTVESSLVVEREKVYTCT